MGSCQETDTDPKCFLNYKENIHILKLSKRMQSCPFTKMNENKLSTCNNH